MRAHVALLSVDHKDARFFRFARLLYSLGWILCSYGGTLDSLNNNGIPTRDALSLVSNVLIGGRNIKEYSKEAGAAVLSWLAHAPPEDLVKAQLQGVDLVCVGLKPNPTKASDLATGGIALLDAAIRQESLVITPSLLRDEVFAWFENGQPKQEVWRRYFHRVVAAELTQYFGELHANLALEAPSEPWAIAS